MSEFWNDIFNDIVVMRYSLANFEHDLLQKVGELLHDGHRLTAG